MANKRLLFIKSIRLLHVDKKKKQWIEKWIKAMYDSASGKRTMVSEEMLILTTCPKMQIK